MNQDHKNASPLAPPPQPAPRTGFGVGVLAFAVVLTGVVVGGGAYWLGGRRDVPSPTPVAAAPKRTFQCPMHPSIVQDHPADCPICGMKLVQLDAAPAPTTAREPLFYRSPMDPKVTSHTPMKDEMGMDYVPVYSDDLGHNAPPVKGQATVDIDPARQQLIGLTTSQVSSGEVGGAWRTVGRVSVDETRVRHINLKVPGVVERIYVDFVGKPVRRGDPLFALYSPELLAAQEEYLLALRTSGALARAGGLATDGDTLVKAARRKLALWDISEADTDRIAKTGETTRTMTVYSPVSGVVTKKDVVEGMKLEAGAMPYEIVDLSSVWVLADIYESELRFIKDGMPATLTLNAFPNREFQGKVLFIDPLLDPKTRTVKVRLAFPNTTGDLRPEMFGDVVLHGAPRQGLRVPKDAVVDSGTEKIVFVALGAGKFQPRIVRVGDTRGAFVEVISGLAEGDEVVTRANFLIDSESKLRASLAEMVGGRVAPAPESARVLPGAPSSDETGRAPTTPAPAPGAKP